jgi:hypothetical protein
MVGVTVLRVYDRDWVIDFFLKEAVCMRKGFCAGAETHVLAKVIPAFGTVMTGSTHYSGLNGYSLADWDVVDAWTDSSDHTRRFVTQHERSLDNKFAISGMKVVMYWKDIRSVTVKYAVTDGRFHRDQWTLQLLGPGRVAVAKLVCFRYECRGDRGGRQRAEKRRQ